MTLHWWMHWFWVTVVAVVAVLASEAWCAPQSNHPVYAAVHSGNGPTGSSAAEYMALLSDLDHPPATGAQDYNAGFGEDEEDTYGGANLFPVHRVVIAAPADFPTTYVPLMLAPQQPRHDLLPTPRDQVVLVTDHSNSPSPTRLGKSVDEMTAAATLIPAMPVQYKNRNPFINEEMQSGRSGAVVVVPAAESSTTEVVPPTSSTTEAPVLEEKMASEDGTELVEASAAPTMHEETSKSTEETNESTPRIAPTASSDGAAQTEEAKATAPTQETAVIDGGTHPIPPWIPDEKQEELDSEEQEREHEQIDRITNALVEEESVDEGEAITRGRMQPNEGLGTPSIIAIVIAFVGIIGMAGAAAGFILYKRSLLNKPQTLNDKISNPDYSSYIDDTLRDNSEEMYSLDNDSFLNSLEAMTIQNFWTENVKHTKL